MSVALQISRNSRRFRWGRRARWWCLIGAMMCCGRGVLAQSLSPSLQFEAQVTEPAPDQDDATLHDVAWAGASTVWAVGARGTIWKSSDGGESWQFLSISSELTRYTFHSICFLTDRVGWIAGGTVLAVGGTPAGIVLCTRDGGETWKLERQTQLPYLRHVQFFDLERGVAVGERSLDFPAGALQTDDGGQTWTATPSQKSGHWNAAAFISPQAGILAGDQGLQGVIDRGSLQNGGPGSRGLRAFRGTSLDARGRGWMAGEGAMLNRSDNFGVSWSPVSERLPQAVKDFTNFHSIAHQGDQAWAAGSPGSVVWHTVDGGQTWEPQPTGENPPLEVIRFLNPQEGVAAGQLGRICLTADGGKTWRTVRGGGRRLACLVLQTHIAGTALNFLTRWAREDGYRTAVMISTRRDTGTDAHAADQWPVRLQHAVTTAGGNHGWIDWRLPLDVPHLEWNREKLIREWTLLNDQRLPEVWLENLVAEIRIWRPSVILIDEPAPGEFATELLQRAVTRAAEQAASAHYSPAQQQLASLAPWKIQKLVMQRRAGTSGNLILDSQEILPHLGTTLELAMSEARGQLSLGQMVTLPASHYVVLSTDSQQRLSDRVLLNDLGLAPGSDARRSQLPLTTLNFDKLQTQAQHRRNLTAITQRMTASPEQAGQILGQIGPMLAPLSPQQAAQQLASLGEMAHLRGEWHLAEAVYSELITRYPDQPIAVEAMLWLMNYWTSAEMNWQRLRTMQATGTTVRGGLGMGTGSAQAKLEQAIQTFRDQPTKTASALNTPSLTADPLEDSRPLTLTSGSLQSFSDPNGASGNQYEMQLNRWQTSAMSVAEALRTAYPQVYQSPRMQFTAAALFRRRNEHRRADEIYSTFIKTLSDDPWNIAARGEAYLLRPGVQSPKAVVSCKTTRIPPILDGILSDPCWKEAQEIRLGDRTLAETFIGASPQQSGVVSRAGAQPVVFLAHDDKNLYVAASVPIHAELPNDPPERAGRAHDADLDRFDFISLQLDVDRDYGTYYRFDIDQRGQTREACWDNWGYNPKWYCVTTREVEAWRVECAIPLDELLPPERVLATTWAVGLTRILPGVGSQSWTGSGATVPQPALFGLMRFD